MTHPDIRLSPEIRIDKAYFNSILDTILLKVTKTYTFPPEIIKIQGITIATIGNFSATTGKPKSKKTFNVSALVAAALSGKQVLQYTACLPPDKKKILYFDTEQSECHCHKVLHRILKLAGLPTDQENDSIEFYVLREFSPEQRRDIIEFALQKNDNVGLVVIDGVRDLLKDINNPTESLDIINDLMRWSSVYGLHIHTVLHLNKQDDNTRGHLGTELNNKAETILQVTKNREHLNMSEVRATHIRDKEFTPFAFEINADALPVLVKGYKPQKESIGRSVPLVDLTLEQHREALSIGFEGKEIFRYNDLLKNVQLGYDAIGFSRGRNNIVQLCKYLSAIGAIIKTEDGYGYNPDFAINPKK